MIPTTRPVNIVKELKAAAVTQAVVPQTYRTGVASRYNGGWTKTVTGLDKSVATGFSIQGDFIHDPAVLEVGSLILDCGIGGSRKNQERLYTLAQVLATGVKILAVENDSRSWAVNLWPTIEEGLAPTDPNLPDVVALIAERESLQRRITEIDALLGDGVAPVAPETPETFFP